MRPSNGGSSLVPSFSTLNPSINGSPLPSSSSWRPFPEEHYSLSAENGTRSDEGSGVDSGMRPRFRWSDDLHRGFLAAVAFLGGEQCATPKAILELLNENELTIHQVSSHLQIYRNHCYEQQQIIAREASAARAQMAWSGNGGGQNYAGQNNMVPNPVWSAPVHYQQQAGYPYGHQLYGAPPSQSLLRPQMLPPPSLLPPSLLLPPPQRSATLYIDPVGPMPPSIPPSMRRLDYSAPKPQTILFEGLFHDCKPELVEGSSSTARNERQVNVSLDLTLSVKLSDGHDQFRRPA